MKGWGEKSSSGLFQGTFLPYAGKDWQKSLSYDSQNTGWDSNHVLWTWSINANYYTMFSILSQWAHAYFKYGKKELLTNDSKWGDIQANFGVHSQLSLPIAIYHTRAIVTTLTIIWTCVWRDQPVAQHIWYIGNN